MNQICRQPAGLRWIPSPIGATSKPGTQIFPFPHVINSPKLKISSSVHRISVFRTPRDGLGGILCHSFCSRLLVDRVYCIVWACATVSVRRAYTSPDFRNTPIGIANIVLTQDVPRVVQSVDGRLTGGRAGKVCGYIFSAGTPLIMVCYPLYRC